MAVVVIEYAPLEDELGDVIEKAMTRTGHTGETLARAIGMDEGCIRDAIDYRYDDLRPEQVTRMAKVLGLNEVGFAALAQGHYPLPVIAGLPCCLYPLRMPHGIGVANAYIVSECGTDRGLLFDAGVDHALLKRVWPKAIRKLDAIFITHAETEHVGGLSEVLKEFSPVPVFGPVKCATASAVALAEGARLTFGPFEVTVLATPGHAEAHNCYVVRASALKDAAPILISGDLFFAGSVGGAYFCSKRLALHIARIFELLPDRAVVAPGHGPLTTIKNERTYNPFVT